MRFSLKALLLFAFVVAICVAVFVAKKRRADTQAAVVALVNSTGGSALYDYQKPQIQMLSTLTFEWRPDFDDSEYSPGESDAPEFLVDFLGIDFFHSVHFIAIGEPSYLSPEDRLANSTADQQAFADVAEKVAQLEDLEGVRIRSSLDCDLTPLSQLQDLQYVLFVLDVDDNSVSFLQGSKVNRIEIGGAVSDQALVEIAKLKSLEKLQMPVRADRGSTFTNFGVKEIAESETLSEVELNSNYVDDGVFGSLSRMPRLKKLCLRLPSTNTSASNVITAGSLRDIRLVEMLIDDEFFQQARRLDALEILCLADSRNYPILSDDAFKALLECESLNELHLGGIGCSKEQFDSLASKFGEGSFTAAMEGTEMNGT